MLMCDQDHDGSHIKGLFINFLHYFYPNLLRSGFVEEFITPIIKVSNKRESMAFFSVAEFEKWKNDLIAKNGFEEIHKWKVKYYKGLGTSTSNEAKEYFSNLNSKHRILFTFDKNKKTEDNLIDMVFAKSKAQKRKEWLSNYKLLSESEGHKFIDHSVGQVSISDFFNKEFIHFSQYDNVRSIPLLIDGLKPSQRKVLYAIMNKRKGDANNEIKVAQLAGYVSEITAYHHGEASLNSTIVNMAQDFVGSGNNIPLLYPSGQFGTRLQGGKDAASARYIFTRLNGLTRYIFPEVDDAILEYNEEDGMKLEPKFFVPILPMVLVNGAEGMGTGWSTNIPTFHPLDIIKNLKNMLEGKPASDISIWTRGFKGSFEYEEDKKRFVTYGLLEFLSVGERGKNYKLRISELPLGKWTEDYKNFLLDQINENDALIKEFTEHHTDVNVCFDVTISSDIFEGGVEEVKKLIEMKALHRMLKLESYISLSNMTLFDAQGRITQYESAKDIILAFYPVRLAYYSKRKDFLLNQYRAELKLLGNKLKFLKHFISGSNTLLNFTKKKRDEMMVYLRDELQLEPINDSFQYVLNLPLWNLTEDNVQKLQNQFDEKQEQWNSLNNKTPEQLWLQDLEELETALTNCKNYVL
jgi:DNA topoisomerase-2